MAEIHIKKVHGSFTIDTELLAQLVSQKYGLQIASEFEYIDSGFVNANLKFVSTAGKYVIRFYGKFSIFTEQEIEIQSRLASMGLTTPKVLTDKEGRLINDYRGFSEYKFAIFRFIQGQLPKPDKPTAYRVGRLVGEAQAAFREIEKDISVDRRSWIEEKYKSRYEVCEYIEENYQALRGILTAREFEITPRLIDYYRDLEWNAAGAKEQIVHADIYNPNILDDGETLALLDFEAVSYGPAVIDSMTYLAWDLLARDEYANTEDEIFARIESYMQGLKQAGGNLENPEFCYQLISAICIGAASSNIANAIKQGYNAFTRLERYFDNVEFARKNKRRLLELL